MQFSGGKDSTALMYLLQGQDVTAFFGDTGAVYPHVVDHVHETCQRLNVDLITVRPEESVLEYTKRVGLPSDIVPIETMDEMQPLLAEKSPVKLQSYMKCCTAMLFAPMERAIKASGITVVCRGSKASDRRVGVGPWHVEDGITYFSPLWNWSDAEVMGYLGKLEVELPKHYGTVPDSLDCWCCTAHLIRHGREKLAYTKANHPDLWPELQRRTTALRETLFDEYGKVAVAFGAA